MTTPSGPEPERDSWLEEAECVDSAIYAAVAGTHTPRLDVAMRRLSTAANYSRLSIASSVLLSALGGPRGRRAAAFGLVGSGVTQGGGDLRRYEFQE